MKEFTIRDNEAGQRLDKYLAKLLKEAPPGFFYKMLRKKNITLNGKKAAGREILAIGDQVKLFLSDETFGKFAGKAKKSYPYIPLSIVYEDEDILLINKPQGMLSQPDERGEASLTEYLVGYLLHEKAITEEDLQTFCPAICNRLDRNTSGLVAAGKSLLGLQKLSQMFHDRTMDKYYLCITKGLIKEEQYLEGYLYKDKTCNKVTVWQEPKEGALPIKTRYQPLGRGRNSTLLEVELITGRPHQIRAHLSSLGHPIYGDPKYGDRAVNQELRRKYKLDCQLLHAYCLKFPRLTGRLARLSGKVFTASLPEQFQKILKEEQIEEKRKNENLA